ncbi:hypothetical protein Q3G72_020134 [Acer saccharum]|nr:hypothetical protein Q3G72_020134 [Acer saccharum]
MEEEEEEVEKAVVELEKEMRNNGNAQRVELCKVQTHNDVVVPYDSLRSTPTEIKKILDKLVVLKFIGVLGTTMHPKSVIKVCDGLTFIDLTIKKIESLNSKYGCNVPLLLFNSNDANDDTLKSMHPLVAEDFSPFPSKYVLISFEECPYCGKHDALLLEVTPRTLADEKSATLISYDGKVQLLEIEQVPDVPEMDQAIRQLQTIVAAAFKGNDEPTLQLQALAGAVEGATHQLEFVGGATNWFFDFVFGVNLPQSQLLPVKAATLDLETTTRSAIRFFDSAIAINMSRSRFFPLKSTSDLLLVQVTGNVWFGAGITLKRKVTIAAKPGVKLEIPDGAILENKDINGPEDL